MDIGEVTIHHSSPTLRQIIIVLVYAIQVNNQTPKLCCFLINGQKPAQDNCCFALR